MCDGAEQMALANGQAILEDSRTACLEQSYEILDYSCALSCFCNGQNPMQMGKGTLQGRDGPRSATEVNVTQHHQCRLLASLKGNSGQNSDHASYWSSAYAYDLSFVVMDPEFIATAPLDQKMSCQREAQSAESARSKPVFMTLPINVRIKIYKMSMGRTIWFERVLLASRRSAHPPLLRVSRIIRREAMQVFDRLHQEVIQSPPQIPRVPRSRMPTPIVLPPPTSTSPSAAHRQIPYLFYSLPHLQ
jgi:hypothetical protein